MTVIRANRGVRRTPKGGKQKDNNPYDLDRGLRHRVTKTPSEAKLSAFDERKKTKHPNVSTQATDERRGKKWRAVGKSRIYTKSMATEDWGLSKTGAGAYARYGKRVIAH